MGKEILTFGYIEIEKNKFDRNKIHFLKKMQILRKYYYLTKCSSVKKNYEYFIGYLHNDNKVKPSYIMLPKTSTYVKSIDRQAKWTYFLIEDGDLLKKT